MKYFSLCWLPWYYTKNTKNMLTCFRFEITGNEKHYLTTASENTSDQTYKISRAAFLLLLWSFIFWTIYKTIFRKETSFMLSDSDRLNE